MTEVLLAVYTQQGHFAAEDSNYCSDKFAAVKLHRNLRDPYLRRPHKLPDLLSELLRLNNSAENYTLDLS